MKTAQQRKEIERSLKLIANLYTKIDRLKFENKQLKEQVKVLEDALQWIEMKSWQKGEWNDMKDINNKAKAALSIK